MGPKKQSKQTGKRIFEPITDDQITKIHARTAEIGLTEKGLYAMVEEISGFASITAMSKQEAEHLIERLHGPTRWTKPKPPWTEDQIWGDASDLPYWRHVNAIRTIAKKLGWDKDHLKAWLRKCFKVKSIRELDRKTAHGTYVGITNIIDRDKEL